MLDQNTPSGDLVVYKTECRIFKNTGEIWQKSKYIFLMAQNKCGEFRPFGLVYCISVFLFLSYCKSDGKAASISAVVAVFLRGMKNESDCVSRFWRMLNVSRYTLK